MITFKIKTPKGEKEFSADDISYGAFEECIGLEGLSDVEALRAFPRIVRMIFPEITEEEIKYAGMRQIMKLVTQDIKELMNPLTEAVKN